MQQCRLPTGRVYTAIRERAKRQTDKCKKSHSCSQNDLTLSHTLWMIVPTNMHHKHIQPIQTHAQIHRHRQSAHTHLFASSSSTSALCSNTFSISEVRPPSGPAAVVREWGILGCCRRYFSVRLTVLRWCCTNHTRTNTRPEQSKVKTRATYKSK